MVNKEFFEALNDLVKEKGISQEEFIKTLENALASAYKKQFEGGAEIVVTLDPEVGTIEFRAYRYVVEEVMDKDKEIALEDAQELEPRKVSLQGQEPHEIPRFESFCRCF